MKCFYYQPTIIRFLLVILCSTAFNAFSQNVGINSSGAAPDASAGLDVSFTNKGLLIPNVQLTGTTDVTTITSPATSLLVYNKTAVSDVVVGYYYYNGSRWVLLNPFNASSGNFYLTSGKLGLGTTNPLQKLSINSTDPLALHGLQTGTNADSILTVSGGVIKKLSSGSLVVSTSSAWNLIGNSNADSASNFIGTTNTQPLRFRTNNVQRVQITGGGNVGINLGTTIPTYRLQIGSNANPLWMSGVQLGTTTDSTLTIVNKVVRKLPPSWSTNGNVGIDTTTNFIGTTSNTDFIFRANNSEKMRIKNDGRVRFGTADLTVNSNTTPAEKVLIDGNGYKTGLNVIGNTNSYFQVQVQNRNTGNDASSDFVVASNNADYYVDFGINSTGYTESKSNILNQINTAYLYASCPEWFYIGHGVSGQGLVFFTNSGAINEKNSADGFARMEIDSDGHVGIGDFKGTGNQDPNYYYIAEKLMVDGNITPKTNNSGTIGTSTYKWNTVYATNGTINTSDRRLKTNIKPLQYGLNQVMALEPVTFNWKSEPTGSTKVGLIAQDLKKVVPEVVVGDESKETLGVAYSDLVPVLINAIKEQQKQIDDLKKVVAELQKK